MHPLAHIGIRLAAVVVVSWVGVYGYNYWKNKPVEKESKAKQEQRGKKKRSPGSRKNKIPKARIKGLKTEVVDFEPVDYQVEIRSQGIVKAVNVTSMTPQVSGRVIYISEQFQDGTFVNDGDVLIKIDPADYKTAIAAAEASLARSEANLAQEKARGEQALRNWQDIGFKEKPNDLVLRKPQLREAQANVKSATAALARAQRNLKKCEVIAPFSGIIRNRLVGLGTSVTANTKLGEILSTDFAEIHLPLTASQRDQLTDNPKPQISLLSAIQKNTGKEWKGKIVRELGEMDLASREHTLIARVEDPFNLKKTHKIPLRFNQPVIAKIPGNTFANVCVIDRSHVYGIRDIITVEQGKIRHMKVEPIWEDEKSIIVRADSIPSDRQLATSQISFAAEGAKVTVIDEQGYPVEQKKSETEAANPNKESKTVQKDGQASQS